MENETDDAQQYELKKQLTKYLTLQSTTEIENLVLYETAKKFSSFYLN